MDPMTALTNARDWRASLADRQEAALDLLTWLAMGGFAPAGEANRRNVVDEMTSLFEPDEDLF